MKKKIIILFFIFGFFILSAIVLFRGYLGNLKKSNEELTSYLQLASGSYTRQSETFDKLEKLNGLIEQPMRLAYISDINEFKKQYAELIIQLKIVSLSQFQSEIDNLVKILVRLYEMKSSEITAFNAAGEIEQKRLPVLLDNLLLLANMDMQSNPNLPKHLKSVHSSLVQINEDILSLKNLTSKSKRDAYSLINGPLSVAINDIKQKIFIEQSRLSGNVQGSLVAIQGSIKKTNALQSEIEKYTEQFSYLSLAFILILAGSLILIIRNYQRSNDLKLQQQGELLSIFNDLGRGMQDDARIKLEKLRIDDPILNSARALLQNIVDLELERQKSLRNELLVSLSSQVSHDIRSPLSALTLMTSNLSEISESKRVLIRNAVNRISDIANDLLQKGKEIKKSNLDLKKDLNNQSLNLEKIWLSALIDSIVSEKRIQYRTKQSVEIDADLSQGYGKFVNLHSCEFKRVLSNLINNSVESLLNDSGRIQIRLLSTGTKLSVVVQDNGCGMPDSVMKQIGKIGFTHGKERFADSGSGLGLYHAKSTVEACGGHFEVSSQVNVGTTIKMTFNVVQTPSWFVEKLNLEYNTKIISLDDDISIHQIWQSRFSSNLFELNNIKLLSFVSAQDFIKWFNINYVEGERVLFLIDYELLEHKETGLDLIEKLKIEKKSILVSSRYDETKVRTKCEELGVTIIPKTMAGFIPIEIKEEKQIADAVLIDDDDLVRMSWELYAKEKNKILISYSSTDEFLNNKSGIPFQTPIYIDSNLQEHMSGEERAQDIYNLGYHKITLCTGYDATDFSSMPWISQIQGKDPSF